MANQSYILNDGSWDRHNGYEIRIIWDPAYPMPEDVVPGWGTSVSTAKAKEMFGCLLDIMISWR